LFIIEAVEAPGPTRQALGFDIASEANRKSAAVDAVNQDRTILTRAITLHNARLVSPSFLLLKPVYKSDRAPASAQDRWAELRGWVFSPVRSDELFAGVAAITEGLVDFEVYEDDRLLRARSAGDGLAEGAPQAVRVAADSAVAAALAAELPIEMYGRSWSIRV
jgi:CHASE1-domain containing sensor protein